MSTIDVGWLSRTRSKKPEMLEGEPFWNVSIEGGVGVRLLSIMSSSATRKVSASCRARSELLVSTIIGNRSGRSRPARAPRKALDRLC